MKENKKTQLNIIKYNPIDLQGSLCRFANVLRLQLP